MTATIFKNQSTPSTPNHVCVIGASGGIGREFCLQLAKQFPKVEISTSARETSKIPKCENIKQSFSFDITDFEQQQVVVEKLIQVSVPDWIFIATGWLHDKNFSPEKTWRSINAEHLQRSHLINCVAPAMLIQAFLKRLPKNHETRIGVLSARLGSISDNKMGGWHAYRASKAALNMLIKNYAIELNRQKSKTLVCALQPGTTDTALSAPFQKNLTDGQLQTPEFTAQHLIKVMQALQTEHSGEMIDFAGNIIQP